MYLNCKDSRTTQRYEMNSYKLLKLQVNIKSWLIYIRINIPAHFPYRRGNFLVCQIFDKMCVLKPEKSLQDKEKADFPT